MGVPVRPGRLSPLANVLLIGRWTCGGRNGPDRRQYPDLSSSSGGLGLLHRLHELVAWTRSGSELRKTSEGPFGVGTTVESVKPMFGREIRSQRLVATRYEPPYLVSFKAVVPVIGDLIGGFTLESVDGGTRLSRWAELNAGGIRGAIGSILAPFVRRVVGDGAVEPQAPHRSADRLGARAGAGAFDAGSDGRGTRRRLGRDPRPMNLAE